MKIAFEVGGSTVEFSRSWFTGRTTLAVDGTAVTLQDPLRLGTHFALATTRSWNATVAGRAVRIEKQRPRWFAGFRPQDYRVFVEDTLVVERAGF